MLPGHWAPEARDTAEGGGAKPVQELNWSGARRSHIVDPALHSREAMP
jgi:hypothetical protein